MKSKEIDYKPEFAAIYDNNNKFINVRNQALLEYIKNGKLKDIKRLLDKHKSFVNSPILVNGFTALHLACLLGKELVVNSLIKEYHADVNVFAKDGTQPLHLNSLQQNYHIVDFLLEAGANPEAEITEKIYLKYKGMSDFLQHTEWCNDFGDTVKLVVFNTVVFKVPTLSYSFIKFGANLNVTSRTNQTLLMHMCIKGMSLTYVTSANNLDDRNIVVARDDDGFTAAHHLIYSSGFAVFSDVRVTKKTYGLMFLDNRGADINATINGDPDTIPLNVAASKWLHKALEFLLPRCADILTKSKVLNNFVSSLRNCQGNVFNNFTQVDENIMTNYLGFRGLSFMLILQDLANRLAFGLHVLKKEKKLFKQLIAKHSEAKNFVYTHEKNVINGKLKKEMIRYGDKSTTFYDLISLSANRTKLQLLITDQTFVDACRKSNIIFDFKYFDNIDNYAIDKDGVSYFRQLITVRIERAFKRIELLEKLKKIKLLRNAIPLPYELVLEIVDYFDNHDLYNFIDAFYLS